MTSQLIWGPSASTHNRWVAEMNWHNKTVLESQALIASEIGELAGELSDTNEVHSGFGEELADIVLRTLDLSVTTNVDIDAQLAQLSDLTPNGNLHLLVCNMMVDMAHWINTARSEPLAPTFPILCAKIIRHTENLATSKGVNLFDEVQAKIEKNRVRGTRGRRV